MVRRLFLGVFSRCGYHAATGYFSRLTDITLQHLEPYDVVVLDKDNLLVPYKGHELVPGSERWINELKQAGKTIVILSNCPQRGKRAEHLQLIAESLGVEHHRVFGLQRKPRPHGFRYIQSLTGGHFKRMCMIGDQQFTDIAGARRLGMGAFYVKPCGKDGWHTRHKRLLERMYFLLLMPEWK